MPVFSIRRSPFALLASASLALPCVLRAQTPTLTTDLALNSAYVWRGVTSTNRFVLEPDLLLGVPLGRTQATLTLGAWTNIEPAPYDGPRDISPLGGEHGPAATSSQLWIEAKRAFGASAVTLGATRYLYPNVGTLSQAYATNELYAIVAAPTVRGFAPQISAYYDVQKIRGAYIEGALSHDVGVPNGHGAHQTVTFSSVVGYSAGQAEDARGVQSAYFANEGLTHVDLGARTSVSFGALSVSPTAHLVVGRDALVRVTAPERSHVAKVWLGASLSWATALGHVVHRTDAAAPDAAPHPAPSASDSTSQQQRQSSR